jgi:hypothetical protein
LIVFEPKLHKLIEFPSREHRAIDGKLLPQALQYTHSLLFLRTKFSLPCQAQREEEGRALELKLGVLRSTLRRSSEPA